MQYQAKTLNAACDPSFRLRAFSDYCEQRQKLSQEYIQLLNEAINSVEDTDDGNYQCATVDNLMREHPSFSKESYVLTNYGYIKLQDILSRVMNGVGTAMTSGAALEEATVPVIDANHSEVNTLSVSDLLQDAQASLHSITALCAANVAALQDKVTDKLTVFRDRMQRYFQSGYSDISNMASYYLSLVEQTHSQEEYLDQVYAGLDVDGLAALNSTMIPNQTRVYDITGASPAGPLNWNTVESTVSSAVNVGMQVVKGIFKSVKAGVQRLFSKARKYVHEVITDPFDIAMDFPDSEMNTVDGYSYQINQGVTENGFIVNRAYTCPALNAADAVDLKGSVFKTSLISGEILFEVTDVVESVAAFGFSGNMAFKPRPISEAIYQRFFSSIDQYALDVNNPYKITMSLDAINAMVDSLNSISKNTDMYYTVQNNERDLLKGFIYGYLMTNFLLQANDYELSLHFDESSQMDISYIPVSDVEAMVPSQVTNLTFVEVVAGWDPSTSTYSPDFFAATNKSALDYPDVFPKDSFVTLFKLDGIFRNYYSYFRSILNIKSQEKSDPLSFPFFPYRRNKEGFSSSQLAIKTDTRNYEAFNNFATKVVISAIAVAVAVTGIVISKRILRSITNKRILAKSQIEAKLWKDPPDNVVSKKELRSYARKTKKLSASRLLNSNLQNSSAGVLSALVESSDDGLLTDIITILKG